MLFVFCAILALLFAFVIALPAIRLTVGPHWAIWMAFYDHQRLQGKLKRHHHAHPSEPDEFSLRAAGSPTAKSMGLGGSQPTVNSAMYGASWRRPRALQQSAEEGSWDVEGGGAFMPGSVPLGVEDGPAYAQQASPTGVILDRDGNLSRYDPQAYVQAQRMAKETHVSRSFNAMQVHNIAKPQDEIRREAVETNMLALPGLEELGTGYPADVAAVGSSGGFMAASSPPYRNNPQQQY